jgi:hypothetical protein
MQDNSPAIHDIDALEAATGFASADLLAKVNRAGGPPALQKFTYGQLKAALDLLYAPLAVNAFSSYVALLNQTGTAAPVATVLNSSDANYLGVITWARSSAGIYTATRTGAFTQHKTVVLIQNRSLAVLIAATWTDANTITVSTATAAGVVEDADLVDASIEIRVYA